MRLNFPPNLLIKLLYSFPLGVNPVGPDPTDFIPLA